jgi:hypothetical protein
MKTQNNFGVQNLLFSDTFAADFASIGNVATREQVLLDTGRASNNDEHFWEQVEQVAFMEPNEGYD